MAGKRRRAAEKDEEDESDESDEVEKEPAPQKKPKASVKKAESKKKKKESEPESEGEGASSSVKIGTNDEGEKYFKLSAQRRVTVREFKGKVMVDIREFYTKDGKERPGSKGISLNAEQWDVLKKVIDPVDQLLAEKK